MRIHSLLALMMLVGGGCTVKSGDGAQSATDGLDEQGPVPNRVFGNTRPDCLGTGGEDIQILGVSDWHAQLDPIGDVGGAAVLSAYFKKDIAENPRTLILTAGDATGASPPLSSFFGDEPAIKAMNLMGFTADTFGNHNFDRGIAGLQKHIDLASFPYVSSNLSRLDQNLQGVKRGFHIVRAGKVKVGIIGITNPDAPQLGFPGNMGTLEVQDAAASANFWMRAAELAGAKINVVLVHMGATHVDAAGQPQGPLIEFAKKLYGADVVLGDHTDLGVNTTIGKTMVVENRSKGLTYAKIKLHVTGTRITSKSVQIVTPTRTGVTPDPAIETMLTPYRAQLSTVYDTKIGIASDVFQRGSNQERLKEMPIGNLVADAMREAYGTQIAFTNGGGLRAALPSSYLPADTSLRRTTAGYAAGPPYDLVIGDIFAVLPFGNAVVTRTITGAQLCAALERSVGSLPAAFGGFLQISGFKFSYSASAPAGARVSGITLDSGAAVACDAATYTAALPDFMNVGGDGYTMFADGNGVSRDVMADVLQRYVTAKGTITPTSSGRINPLP